MKTRTGLLIGLLAGLLLTLSSAAIAQNRYVTDELEITLRSGPGLDYRIVAMVKAGAALEVVKESDGWTRVRMGDKEGWIVSRYVTDAPPKGPQLTAARARIDKLKDDNEKVATRLKQTETELVKASNEAKKNRTALDKVTKEYDAWKKTNAGVITLQENHETLKADSAAAREEVKALRLENRALSAKKNTYWFLCGALVLLIGYVMGYVYVTSRGKKKAGYRF